MTSFRFCVLASGSKGNALWVEAGDDVVLVDCGLSGKELKKRLAAAGLDPCRIKAVLVTHEHRDHILGAGVAARLLKKPLYINRSTWNRAAPTLGRIEPVFFETGRRLVVGDLAIHPFSTSHDSADPVGFTFQSGDTRLGLATDLGIATALVKERLRGCQALILESNHDPQMLIDGPYPWDLKRRVRGRQGHLSNEDAALLLAELLHPGLSHVVLAHLSEVNNRPELALEAAGSVLNKKRPALCAAGQHQAGAVIEIIPPKD